jgi:hypothetical protein
MGGHKIEIVRYYIIRRHIRLFDIVKCGALLTVRHGTSHAGHLIDMEIISLLDAFKAHFATEENTDLNTVMKYCNI